jgi:hypothetical protein
MTRQLNSIRARQGGFTLFGLLFWAIAIGFLGYLAIRVVPTVNEYLTIQSLVNKVAEAPPASVPEIRSAFDRYREIEYSVKSIAGKDLDISKEGNRVVITFAYEKEVPLGGPAYLLLKYRGRSK